MVRVNLAEVEEKDFEAIPAGKYIVKIEDFEMKETKDKPENKLPGGTPMINWEFTVIRDEHGDEKYKNRKLWMNSIIHPTTLFNLKGMLRACGWTDEQLNDEELDFDPESILGCEVVATVTQRPYNGDMTNDVKRLKPLSSLKEEVGAGSLLP